MGVREKKVELFELFYDLVFVYAISRVTLILEEPVGGTFTLSQMAIYIISTLTVFQAWVFMTNYINRYGQWRWHEYLLLSINMFAAIYLSQSIRPDWGIANQRVFIASMMVLVVTVQTIYAIQMYSKVQDRGAAKQGFVCPGIILCLFLISLLASYTNLNTSAFYFLIAAIVMGIVLPLLEPELYDSKLVCFPHLAERFELLTIITFGEGIVGMTRFFDIHEFSAIPWTVFITFFMMFGCYVLQIHNLCDHHRTETGKRLMFTHYFNILSVNLVTVSYLLISSGECDHSFTASLMSTSLFMFFTGILLDSPYYHKEYSYSIKDYLVSLAIVAVGVCVMFAFQENDFSILYGAFIAVFGNLLLLSFKFNKHRPRKSVEPVQEE